MCSISLLAYSFEFHLLGISRSSSIFLLFIYLNLFFSLIKFLRFKTLEENRIEDGNTIIANIYDE